MLTCVSSLPVSGFFTVDSMTSFLAEMKIADGVVRLAGPGHFLDGQHLVSQRVFALVEQRPVGQAT